MKKLILMLMLFAPLSLFAQQKFGHLDTQAVLQSMPEFAAAQVEVKNKADELDKQMKQMQDEFTRKSQEYDKNKSTMNATKQKETEAELQTMYQKLQQTYQDNQKTMQELQNQKMTPITTKLVNAIKNVGKNGGYVYIMDTNSGIPYVSDTLSKDVTADVKAELGKMK